MAGDHAEMGCDANFAEKVTTMAPDGGAGRPGVGYGRRLTNRRSKAVERAEVTISRETLDQWPSRGGGEVEVEEGGLRAIVMKTSCCAGDGEVGMAMAPLLVVAR